MEVVHEWVLDTEIVSDSPAYWCLYCGVTKQFSSRRAAGSWMFTSADGTWLYGWEEPSCKRLTKPELVAVVETTVGDALQKLVERRVLRPVVESCPGGYIIRTRLAEGPAVITVRIEGD